MRQNIFTTVIFMIATCLIAGTTQAETVFPAAMYATAGTGPNDVVISDLNGDGYADLAVSNATSNDVEIMLGAGDGSVSTSANYLVGTNPYGVSLGDLNGDGYADLVLPNRQSANVSVLLGNGDATFNAAVNYGAGQYPEDVQIADLNGDAYADLTVVNYLDNTVSVLLGVGDGTFNAAVNYAVGNAPHAVSVIDLNADTFADLSVVNGSTGDVSVLIGNGDGTFVAAVNYTAGWTPSAIAASDFNSDGIPDLAVEVSTSNSVGVFFGVGDGTFNAITSIASATNPTGIAVSDLNGDGYTDIISTTQSDILVSLGDGSGAFSNSTYPSGFSSAVAIGDLNGDGYADAVVPRGTTAVAVYLGSGGGGLHAARSYAAGASYKIAVNDLNLDGYADMAAGGSNVRTLLGLGGGDFSPSVSYVLPSTEGLASGDLNGDGFPDLAGVDFWNNNVYVQMNQGDGSYGSVSTYAVSDPWNPFTSQYPVAVEIGEFTGDGYADIAAVGNFSGNLLILPGLGDGTIGANTADSFGSTMVDMAVGDFNADGLTDIAALDSAFSRVTVWEQGVGVTGFYAVTMNANSTIDTGDVNQDGYSDLAVASSAGTVGVLINDGLGGFAAAVDYPAGISATQVSIADINGDTFADLVTADVSGVVSVLPGDGTTFAAPQMHSIGGASIQDMVVEDLNGDGGLDVTVADSATGVYVLYNQLSFPKGSVSIENSATYTNSLDVILTMSCSTPMIGCLDVRISNDQQNWSFWTPVGSSMPWRLKAGADGARTVYVQFRGGNGKVGAVTSDSILLDTAAPGAPVIQSPVDNILTANTVRPDISGTAEANSTVTVMDGATQLGMLSADGGGAWSLAGGPVLADGVHLLTATATDAAGNTSTASTIVTYKVDTTAPVITLNGLANMQIAQGAVFTDPGATALDNIDGNLTSAISVSGVVDTSVAGVYVLVYTATDTLGHIGVATRTVVVVNSSGGVLDTTPPVITLNGAASISLMVGDSFADPGATATDNVDGDLTASISVTGTVDTTTPNAYVLLYTVSDSAGNIGVATRIVLVSAPSTTTVVSNGGCSMDANGGFDPMLLLLVIASLILNVRRRMF